MKKIVLLFIIFFVLILQNQAQTVTDIDGNVYNTVTIGTQTWMAENLKVTHYRNGDSIPYVTDSLGWMNILFDTGAYCYYNCDTNLRAVYGNIYNPYSIIDSRHLCPEGWHVPTEAEWQTLSDFLGGQYVAGGKIKEVDTTHWKSPNTGATNESGFTGLPGGCKSGWYMGMGDIGEWVTFASEDTTFGIVTIYNSYAWFSIMMGTPWWPVNEYNGNSVRCICDSTVIQIHKINNNEGMHIYPNPAKDKITINYAGREDMNMFIYNIVGECVLKRELNNTTNEIDIRSLSEGMYIIKIAGAQGTMQSKLIKE